MPYRRLPNTDKARIKAIRMALNASENKLPADLAYSQSNYVKIKALLPLFEQQVKLYNDALSAQVKNSKLYYDSFQKARIYVSHFVQVMNMSMIRKEIPETDRKYYGLENYVNKVPALNSETDIIEWGKKIIKGEEDRLLKGGNPVLNPKIAIVKIKYEKFVELYHSHKTFIETTHRYLDKIESLRPQLDELIVNIWNEVEDKFNSWPADIKRQKSMEYGIAYVYRKSEKIRMAS